METKGNPPLLLPLPSPWLSLLCSPQPEAELHPNPSRVPSGSRSTNPSSRCHPPAQLLPFNRKSAQINICHPHVTFRAVSRSTAAVPALFYSPAQPCPHYLQLSGLSLSLNFPLRICKKEMLHTVRISLTFALDFSALFLSAQSCAAICSQAAPGSLLTHPTDPIAESSWLPAAVGRWVQSQLRMLPLQAAPGPPFSRR